jgi:O-antigen ligase
VQKPARVSVVDPTHDVVALGAVTALLFLAVAFAAAWLARARPSHAIVLLLAAAPFDIARYVGQTTVTTEKAALVGAGIGMLLVPEIRRALAGLRREPLFWCALALVVVTFATDRVAVSHTAVLRETLKAAQYLATFALAWAATRIDRDDAPLTTAVPALIVVVALGALAQLVTGAPAGLWIGAVAVPRIAGALEGPNQLAGYLGLLLPIALLAAHTPLGRAALALGGATLVLTLSRSGIAATLLALALALWWLGPEARRTALRWVLAGLGSGAVAALGIGEVLIRSDGVFAHLFSTSEIRDSGGVGTRSELWHGAYTLWRRHPLFGIGAGNFEFEVGTVTRPGIRTHANSWYLQALVEGGFPLLATTLATVWYATGDLVRRLRERPLVAVVAAASIGFCVHQIGDFLVFYPKDGATWWLLLGVAAARTARA